MTTDDRTQALIARGLSPDFARQCAEAEERQEREEAQREANIQARYEWEGCKRAAAMNRALAEETIGAAQQAKAMNWYRSAVALR